MLKDFYNKNELKSILISASVDTELLFNWAERMNVESVEYIAAAIAGWWASLPVRTQFARMRVLWDTFEDCEVEDLQLREDIWHAARYIEDCVQGKGKSSLHLAFLAG